MGQPLGRHLERNKRSGKKSSSHNGLLGASTSADIRRITVPMPLIVAWQANCCETYSTVTKSVIWIPDRDIWSRFISPDARPSQSSNEISQRANNLYADLYEGEHFWLTKTKCLRCTQSQHRDVTEGIGSRLSFFDWDRVFQRPCRESVLPACPTEVELLSLMPEILQR